MPVQISYPQPPDEMEVDAPPDEQPIDASEEEYHVVENATMDIETYAYSYLGMARLFRLIYVADHCPALRLEALKYAFNHVQCTYNVALYQQIHAKLVDALGATNQPDAVKFTGFGLDTKWIESQTKKGALKLEKLDADLQNYKSNSIKESIRRGYNAIGDHYLDSGDLNNALKCYSRARDYCTSNKHIVDMCLNVIKVSIYLKNWTHVQSYVNKAESHGKDLEPHIVTKLHCAMGLAELANKKYKSAAKSFLQSSFDHCEFPDLMSPSNVATYGSLCALATFDRKEMLKHVISNSSFKQFLELEPQLRDIIFTFYESKYAHCLKLLDEIKDNLYLDIYLAPHIKSLYAQIRNRALIQYFSPYLSADMYRMAEAFNTDVPTLEDEIMRLILDNQISARIDSHKKILYAKTTDQRSSTFEHFLSFAKEYQQKTIAMLLRSAMIRNNICIKTPQGDGAGEMTPGNTTPCN